MMVLGLGGLSLMTWFFPSAVFMLKGMKKDSTIKGVEIGNEKGAFKIEVLIPVHNGGNEILETLQSVQSSLDQAQRLYPALRFSKTVGADGCTDDTIEKVRKEGQTAILSSSSKRGKWNTLNSLIEGSSADWVIFVDAGTQWPDMLVARMIREMQSDKVMGVAPGYRASQAVKLGLVGRAQWNTERLLKGLENLSGGPVSVHGATVAYCRKFALETLKQLRGENWLNDDVVVPLLMRSLYPNHRIVYLPDMCVFDSGCDKGDSSKEYIRRKRLVRGNSQWIRKLLPQVARNDFGVFLLSLRRVFRVFWAYWYALLALGCAEYLGLISLVSLTFVERGFAIVGIAFLIHPKAANSLRSIIMIALASLLSPIDVLLGDLKRPVSWT